MSYNASRVSREDIWRGLYELVRLYGNHHSSLPRPSCSCGKQLCACFSFFERTTLLGAGLSGECLRRFTDLIKYLTSRPRDELTLDSIKILLDFVVEGQDSQPDDAFDTEVGTSGEGPSQGSRPAEKRKVQDEHEKAGDESKWAGANNTFTMPYPGTDDSTFFTSLETSDDGDNREVGECAVDSIAPNADSDDSWDSFPAPCESEDETYSRAANLVGGSAKVSDADSDSCGAYIHTPSESEDETAGADLDNAGSHVPRFQSLRFSVVSESRLEMDCRVLRDENIGVVDALLENILRSLASPIRSEAEVGKSDVDPISENLNSEASNEEPHEDEPRFEKSEDESARGNLDCKSANLGTLRVTKIQQHVDLLCWLLLVGIIVVSSRFLSSQSR